MLERSAQVGAPALRISGLNVFYGHSHALQGVDLELPRGVLSVVGRNGMGKTTMCKAIMGLVRISGGSIRFAGEELVGLSPAAIAKLGIGYVPQGRRLWRSLTVDEHLRLVAGLGRRGAWSPERIYDTFPRLAERRGNGGSQLSGGEQQMLAISRALLANPRLLVMDEPTEGLAPVIVGQVEDMLERLGEEGEIAILVIEQNIGVATAVSDTVAIMVNGRINRVIDAKALAADRALQQRLLGVGRHAHEDVEAESAAAAAGGAPRTQRAASSVQRVYVANPSPPTRWSQPVPIGRIEAASRVLSIGQSTVAETMPKRAERIAQVGPPAVIVAGTLDTKDEELRFIRDLIAARGLRVRLVDLSTSGRHAAADVTARELALAHPRASTALASGDRGVAVAAMAEAFASWITRQGEIAGIISAGGSGATALATPAMRALPVGVPKVMISTMASGDVAQYVGASDLMMLYSVTDVQGLNAISREVLANGANALAGMVEARQKRSATSPARGRTDTLPVVGLTMFGVTTPAVRQVAAALKGEAECVVFHATGTGGQSMEKLVESGLITGVIDLTTTEVCDLLFGGVLPATEDRFGAVIRTRIPYIGACGALDMVNFHARDSVPERYAQRLLHVHNPHVTLMRTTPEENAQLGRWIGERLNRMDGQVRFFLPEGGVSALDARGQPFFDDEARAALFRALESTVRQTATRRLVRLPTNINDAPFAAAVVEFYRELHQGRARRRRATR